MHMINFFKVVSLTLVATFIVSCSISTTMDATVNREVEAATKMKERAKQPSAPSNQDLIKVKDEIWLGNESNVEYEGKALPSYLEGSDGITLVSNRPITLYEIGDMINKTTSLSVRYAPHMLDETIKRADKNKPVAKNLNTDWTTSDRMIVSYQGPLSGLLNELSSRFGIWWKYERNEIYFYKQITKSFVVYSLPTKSSLAVNVGGSQSGGGTSSSVTLSNSAEIELWGSFEKTITSMIAKDAKLSLAPSDGTITLTASPSDIKLVAKYINEQNRRLSRQVAISVKILQVTVGDSDNYGLDLNAMFSDGTTTGALAGAAAGINSEPFTSGMSWLIADGKWKGSNAIVQAISTQNTTSLVTSGTVTTLNNKPAPIQVTQKQNYIAEMTKTNSGTDGDNVDISVTTEEIETGFTLEVLPRILDHGRMLIMFNLTLSDLLSLDKVEFGDGAKDGGEGQYIQNPKVEARAFTQEVAMTSNESLILTGFEKVSNTIAKTGTGSADNSLLGGSATAKKERSVLVIILTPVLLESPLTPESRMSMN